MAALARFKIQDEPAATCKLELVPITSLEYQDGVIRVHHIPAKRVEDLNSGKLSFNVHYDELFEEPKQLQIREFSEEGKIPKDGPALLG